MILLGIFYLIYQIIIKGLTGQFEDVDIFVKVPIFITGVGILWSMLLILFTQMTTALKDDFK